MSSWGHLSEALPQLAKPDEIAPYLRLTANGVSRMCRDGKLPAVKVGGHWLVHVKRLSELLDGNAVPSLSSELRPSTGLAPGTAGIDDSSRIRQAS